MTEQLQGKRIAVAVANEGVEQVELTRPWEAVRDAGAETELIAPDEGTVQAFNHLDNGDVFDVDKTFDEVDAGDYDGLVLPGGVANPDQLRSLPPVIAIPGFPVGTRGTRKTMHAPRGREEARRDDTAAEPLADKPPESPSEHHDVAEEPGGPYGNPGVDEESLRKQQEESREKSD